jgi:carbonic anhydrase
LQLKLTLLLVSSSALLSLSPAFAETPAHWTYEGKTGATHWAQLDENFSTCGIGKAQSPINIETKKVKKGEARPIAFAYTPAAAEVVNTGHTIQVNTPSSGSASIGGTEYKLLQFHLHTPSEEKVNGKAYPMVAHLVHKNADGKLAVVGVLFKQGKENSALKPVLEELPAKEGEKHALGKVDVAALLPADKSYYSFIGSLTTPPCSEEVRWQVMKTPVEVSSAQIASFKKLYKMNARPVQPLNGRSVELSQ